MMAKEGFSRQSQSGKIREISDFAHFNVPEPPPVIMAILPASAVGRKGDTAGAGVIVI